jgi:RimJ/RimL family protein N-acetyltransferase
MAVYASWMPHATPEVTLRALRAGDAEVMAGWAKDPEFCRAADWSPDLLHDDRVRFFRQLIEAPPPDLIRLAAVHENTVVGYIDLAGTGLTDRELGFVIGDRSTWGGGLGTSAAVAGCEYGFAVLRLRTIWAETEASNVATVRVLQAVGMRDITTGGPTSGSPALRRFQIGRDAWVT